MKRKRTVRRRRNAPKRGKADSTIVDALTDAEIQAAVRDDPDAVPLDFDWSEAVPSVPPKTRTALRRKRKTRT